MNLISVSVLAFVAALASPAASQAPVAGKWQGETRNGNQIVLELAVKESVLSGTFSRNGRPVPIADGKVSKTTISFKAKIGDQVESFSGEVAGEQLKIWLDRQGAESTVVLKRVKSA
ncbi:MAG TPA: hypothetical protein VFO19_18640 [Vicinamibacterales bacterium]|nr:hypothetical protein [Vicinamibacterales bacterium]